MKRPMIFAAILPFAMLSACATRGTPKAVDTACTIFRPLSYAIPPKQADGTRAMAVDTGNRFDTLETIGEVQEHNVRFEAACPKGAGQ